ncbi:MAG: SsrA-binding protein SmpB [Mycoplasma sp.]|nr:SsrA-binding protein SmpB [Mycoplasma sp.]
MPKVIARNKDSKYNFFLEKEIEAGIVLTGNEVKSIREGKVNIKNTFVKIINDEAFVLNMHISQYMNNEHDELRTRKLLLKKREIIRMREKLEQKGFSLLVTKLVFNSKSLIKIYIALGKGKNIIDKREVIKKRDEKRLKIK